LHVLDADRFRHVVYCPAAASARTRRR
jgi:hypothetical protein